MKSFSAISGNVKKILSEMPPMDKLPDADPDQRCPLCDGYGHIIDEKGARPCECVKKEVVQNTFEDSQVPKRFLNESLDTFKLSNTKLRACLNDAKKYVEHYSLENAQGLYIYGPTGVGKTHIAVGIVKALIEKGHSAVFYNIVDLLDAIRATYDPQNNNAPKAQIEERLQRQILVLDDFGVQKTSSWVADRLYALINRRYQDCKTLIITSNLEYDNLKVRVDPALSSRIISMCRVIEVRGSDFRNNRAGVKRPS